MMLIPVQTWPWIDVLWPYHLDHSLFWDLWCMCIYIYMWYNNINRTYLWQTSRRIFHRPMISQKRRSRASKTHILGPKKFLKKVHCKMLSSTLPAFCGQKRSEFGFPFFSSQLCQVEARFGQQVCRVHLPAPLCAADVLPQQGIGFGSTLWSYLIWHTSFQNGPTAVDMPHPTPPNPNAMRNVASTSWRKCKRTLTCPTPPHPTPTPSET